MQVTVSQRRVTPIELHLEYKPDTSQAIARMEAWWEGEILDRPTIQVTAPKADPRPYPAKHHANLRERWMDSAYTVECACIHIANTYWGGEILPYFWPNLGPDVQAACMGAELEFGETTSWSRPVIENLDHYPPLVIDPQNLYTRTLLEMTRLSLEMGRGRFLTGHTDLHPDADLLAALRGPEQLCIDLATMPEKVHELVNLVKPSFAALYDMQRDLMLSAGQSLTISWLPLFAEGRYYIPSNDFSCMISNRDFREFFLPQIIEQTEWLDRSIYHLDGPDALRHLDTLLEIPSLDAIQYVWGAGKGSATDWIPIFQKIQESGKNQWIPIERGELETMMAALHPKGVMLSTWASCEDEAKSLIHQVSLWR